MLNYAEIELLLKTRGIYIENGEKVYPKYGVIFTIVDTKTRAIEGLGRINFNFPIKRRVDKLPVGFVVVDKAKVIADTKAGLRYTTVISTPFDPWVPGELIHTDGTSYISTNPNDTTRDNLSGLAMGELTTDEYRRLFGLTL
jgi:hypothetical protein